MIARVEPMDEKDLQERMRIWDAIDQLSDDAIYITTLDSFGYFYMGKPPLMVIDNNRQEAAFDKLLDACMIHGDVERGHYGYRTTFFGREVRFVLVRMLNHVYDELNKEFDATKN